MDDAAIAGRTEVSRLRGALRASMLTLAVLAVACTPGNSAPSSASLTELVTEGESLVGESVLVVGTVRMFEEDGSFVRHYVIEDERQNRVALVPGDAASRYVGEEVVAVGRFEFDDTVGRLIRVERMEQSPASSPSG